MITPEEHITYFLNFVWLNDKTSDQSLYASKVVDFTGVYWGVSPVSTNVIQNVISLQHDVAVPNLKLRNIIEQQPDYWVAVLEHVAPPVPDQPATSDHLIFAKFGLTGRTAPRWINSVQFAAGIQLSIPHAGREFKELIGVMPFLISDYSISNLTSNLLFEVMPKLSYQLPVIKPGEWELFKKYPKDAIVSGACTITAYLDYKGQANEEDALRHCFWAACLPALVPESLAIEILDAHEVGQTGTMDAVNNSKGINISRSAKSPINSPAYFGEIKELCKAALDNGELRVDKPSKTKTEAPRTGATQPNTNPSSSTSSSGRSGRSGDGASDPSRSGEAARNRNEGNSIKDNGGNDAGGNDGGGINDKGNDGGGNDNGGDDGPGGGTFTGGLG
jgi:hypothetical protein